MFNYRKTILCSIVISRCSPVIFKVLISVYFKILDITTEYLDIRAKHNKMAAVPTL